LRINGSRSFEYVMQRNGRHRGKDETEAMIFGNMTQIQEVTIFTRGL